MIADREGGAGLRVELLDQRQSAWVAVLDEGDRPCECPLIACADAGDELVVSAGAARHRRHSTARARPFRTADAVRRGCRLAPDAGAPHRAIRDRPRARHRGFRNLLLARLISALGTWTAFFAVRIAIYNQTGSAWWVSILLFCELVPGVILGIAVGPLIDRWPRKRMMVFSDLGGAATFAVLPFVHSPAGICALSAVAGFSAAFFRPALLLGDPESRARGLARRRERADPGGRRTSRP